MKNISVLIVLLFAHLGSITTSLLAEDTVLPGVEKRFSGTGDLPAEAADFQRHISPLFGRLGCNGRACHGSFQGRGGFRLSLFGFDFKADHDALMEKNTHRISIDDVTSSLALLKPSGKEMHEGGVRFEAGGWEERTLTSWIAAGAKYDTEKAQKLITLDVSPKEVHFQEAMQSQSLRVIAHWSDGTLEDVTALCRFQSNDTNIAEVDETGKIVAKDGKGDTHVVVFYDNGVVPIPIVRPVAPEYDPQSIATSTRIDALIQAKLSKLGIQPSPGCDDLTYLRRVSLDLSGTLPSEAQVKAFMEDKSQNKREELVDRLLGSEGYAAWWSTKLCDFTGNNPQQLNNVLPSNSASALWYEWVYKRVSENMPYDKIVEGIITANSREEGESYREYCKDMSDACRNPDRFADRTGLTFFWARNNFRSPDDRAIGFAYSFLGIHIQCAQCHKHPFDQWSKDDFQKFSKLFSQVQMNGNNLDPKSMSKEDQMELQAMMTELKVDGKKNGDLRKKLAEELKEGSTIPFSELQVKISKAAPAKQPKKNEKNKKAVPAMEGELLGGEKVVLTDDARNKLMAWLRSDENPYFARAFVNRVWANYFGTGIVQPADDLNLANPPVNEGLLNYLATEFRARGYDMKWLHREIVTSAAYQRSSFPNETNLHDHRNFSRFVPRRLPAEVLYDAMTIATANDSVQNEMVGKREKRAINLSDFDARRVTPINYALGVFGKNTRETNCDCDRSETPSILQTLYLRNDKDVLIALTRPESWYRQIFPDLSMDAKKLRERQQKNMSKINLKIKKLKEAELNVKKELANEEKDAMASETEKEKMEASEEDIELLAGSIRELITKSRDIQTKMAEDKKVLDEAIEQSNHLSDEQLTTLIETAYLRTLTRSPKEEEVQRNLQFVRDCKTISEGMEGVIWALLNTKEFALNH